MTYEETKKNAARQVDEWFLQNPSYFTNWACRIKKQCDQWCIEAEKVKPSGEDVSFGCGNYWISPNPEATNDPYKPMQIKTQIPVIHPIYFLTGKFDEKKKEMRVPVADLYKEDRFMVYLAGLLILHDEIAEYPPITKDIWPDELRSKQAFCIWNQQQPQWSDKSDFIKAALRYVEADLASIKQDGKTSGGEAITLEPPESLGKILWVLKYGLKWWWLLLLAMVIVSLPFLLKFAYNPESEKQSNSPRKQLFEDKNRIKKDGKENTNIVNDANTPKG